MTRFYVTVDVEEDIPGIVPHGVSGVVEGLPRLFALLDELDIKADFFFLASIAREFPDLVRRAQRSGHGIGNHGFNHGILCAKPAEQQREEIIWSTLILQDLCGTRPLMFRAPNFSVDSRTLNILCVNGYIIDSSILPGRVLRRHGLLTAYDHRRTPREPFYPLKQVWGDSGNKILEVPVTENPLRPGAPLGLGALNFYGTRTVFQSFQSMNLTTAVFIIHPWELVDLQSKYPKLPEGYAAACSSDTRPLRELLQSMKSTFGTSTLAQLPSRLSGG